MKKFIWYGKNKHFNEVQFSHAMTTDDLLRGSYPSWFSLDNRKPHNNCEFLAECWFTGFIDIDGKEIFEGDICQNTETDKIIFLVKWYNEASAFGAFLGIENEKEISCPISWLSEQKYLKKIGNVFQNPELL